MQFNLSDRASFEAFGNPRASVDEAANLNEAESVDALHGATISADEPEANNYNFAEPEPFGSTADEAPVIEPSIARDLKGGFSFASFAGGLASFAWIGGAIGVPLSAYGLNAILAMDPAMQAGLLALAFGPAVLLWVAASAAGEAMKARRIAAHLAHFAQDPHYPIAIGEARAQRLSHTVKTEIESLNDAVATALHRLSELEQAARRNAGLFESAVVSSREVSAQMAVDFNREREDLLSLNADMRGQTDTLSHSIGRQVRLMREASKLVKVEIDAAEDVLESHLASFKTSADVMAQRTADFRDNAEAAENATASLNNTMGAMLEGLGEATRLTDAARQSAAQASIVATETANALKDHTQSAVIEAKRAAQYIREETVAMQNAASDTLARLQAAADAARAASEESQAAADRHSAKIEQRLTALAQTARTPKPALAPVAAQTRAQEAPRPTYAAPVQQPVRAPQPVKAASAEDLFSLADFGAPPKRDPDATLKAGAIDAIVAAGVDFELALGHQELERIANRSRHGAEARRRAVYDAAPTAVNRIARHLARNANAKQAALAFHARPDLAKNDRAGESDMVRAYLLLDAVLA